MRQVNYSASGEIKNYETACWFDTLKMLTCFNMNVCTNASSEIEGSKNIERLSLRYQTDVKIDILYISLNAPSEIQAT